MKKYLRERASFIIARQRSNPVTHEALDCAVALILAMTASASTA
jgi:hypothetical protein